MHAPAAPIELTRAAPPASYRLGANPWIRRVMIALLLIIVSLFLFLPLISVFYEAFQMGVMEYFYALGEDGQSKAITLTLLVAGISVPLNVIFGVAAAWAISKYEFPGKSILTALIDLPFAVSPVVAGMIYVLVFGQQGWLGEWLDVHDIHIIFALPGMVLATTFVTFPFVARELIPLMQAQGPEEEEVAITLGASGWQTFWRVTLPNIKWGLLYGVILCNARAMGEFGAVSVVSDKVAGKSNTIPLQIQTLYDSHATVSAFALASILSLLAVVTLVAKSLIQWLNHRRGE